MRFRTKVTATLLAAGLLPLAVLGYAGINTLRTEAQQAAEETVTLTGLAKRDAIRDYLEQQIDWMETLATAPELIRAVGDFAADATAVSEAGTVTPDTEALRALLADRHQRTANTDQAALQRWADDLDPVALTLQQLFLIGNPHPEGSRQAAVSVPGGGRYVMTHRVHHPFLCKLLEQFGYYDILLIAPEDARIVYSVMKEPDLGTSLSSGPYRDSALAKAAVAMIETKGANGTTVVDFSPYEPSLNAPASFVLVPIGAGEAFHGVVAFQISLRYIEDVAHRIYANDTTGRRNYVVSETLELRTIPEGSEGAFIGQRVDSPLLDSIKEQIEGTRVAENELGDRVIAAVEHIDLPGIEWIVVSEVKEEIALAEAASAQDTALRATGILAAVIAISGLVSAHILLRPVVLLGQQLQNEADNASTSLDEATTRAGEAVQSVATVAEETSTQSDVLRNSSQQAANNVQEVSAAVEELASSITDVAEGVHATSSLMREATEKTQLAETALADLEKVADRIRGMVDLINDVANRTNLLALNAAVEAAHAGEAGRGFAVVASEIRKLAGRTTESTEVIGSEVKLVLSAVATNGQAIREISRAVRQVSEMAATLSSSATEQQRVTAQIAQRMNDTASRVSNVDENVETMRQASGNAAQASISLVEDLREVNEARSRIVTAISEMASKIRQM